MRYAIYFTAPSASPLKQFGDATIGYDVDRGMRVPFHSELARLPDWESLTAAPRSYGFHATLKAPFHLADGYVEADLAEAVREIAESLPAVAAGNLSVVDGHRFISLRPGSDAARPLSTLAQTCVEALDRFRAPLTTQDRKRRRPELLTDRQRTYLERWGYPFVADEFMFHMTLSGPIEEDARRSKICSVLREIYDRFCEPVTVCALTLCRQTSQDTCFETRARYGFPGTLP